MRITRRANERGLTELRWLRSRHTFSFGEYFDPAYVAFRSLRVFNEDVVDPGQGFGSHPHKDMEILTYVISGHLRHEDNLGNRSVLGPGHAQAMTAGRGLTHSEFNASNHEPVHFLQVWITPQTSGLTPAYSRWQPAKRQAEPLVLLASPDGAHGSLRVWQDAKVYLGKLQAGRACNYVLEAGRGLWTHCVDGQICVDGISLASGDGLGLDGSEGVRLVGESDALFLLLDLL